MADQLLKNTCFHEIDVAGIPKNSDITRVVSVIDDKATMHTRQADAGDASSTEAFEPELQKPDGTRLFLITSYHEDKAVIDAATVIKAKEDENKEIKLEKTSADGDNKDTELNAAIDKAMFEDPPRITTDIEIKFKNLLGKDKLLEALNSNKNMEEMKALVADAEASVMTGGKRTRRRKNHGSKRRNASNKSGRRASKQSRRRGKKQSKRHGRK